MRDTTKLASVSVLLESVRVQGAAVLAATLTIAALHWSNDGLWFQGDAPRHAANGLFLWDYLRSLPAEPVAFALSYYARYPVIAPLAYPPLFYALEGIAFGLLGPSPYIAKSLVLVSAAIVGLYTMAWARRWGGAIAGWAGICMILQPGIVLYSNAVLLNVPATALAIAALYHLMAWLETGITADKRRFAALTIAALVTYYPAALMLPLAALAMAIYRKRPSARALWSITAAVVAIVLMAALLLPQHWARHAPRPQRLLDGRLWRFYADQLVDLSSPAWIVLGALGAVALLALRWQPRKLAWLIASVPVAIACLVVLPAESDRYALMLVPLIVIGALIALVALVIRFTGASALALAAIVLLLVGLTASSGIPTPVPVVSGFDRVAAYVREHGKHDAILYGGYHDGVFTYYLRAGDPDFEQRVVLAHRLLTRFEQRPDFTWGEVLFAQTPADVVKLSQDRCDCRWIAIEIGVHRATEAERLLRLALYGPEFEHVTSVPVESPLVTRVELYRFLPRVEPLSAVELVFPSFSGRVFPDVQPIRSRR